MFNLVIDAEWLRDRQSQDFLNSHSFVDVPDDMANAKRISFEEANPGMVFRWVSPNRNSSLYHYQPVLNASGKRFPGIFDGLLILSFLPKSIYLDENLVRYEAK